MPTCQESHSKLVEENKIWKIVPRFFRKKSQNDKQKVKPPPPTTGEATSKEMKCGLMTSSEDLNEVAKDIAQHRKHPVEEEERKTSQSSRLTAQRQDKIRASWTYGYVDESNPSENGHQQYETSNEVITKDSDKSDGLRTRLSLLKLEEEDQTTYVRPLKRGESFPGTFDSGTLSKQEARRRLKSWRRTTIVRKNSEKQ